MLIDLSSPVYTDSVYIDQNRLNFFYKKKC